MSIADLKFYKLLKFIFFLNEELKFTIQQYHKPLHQYILDFYSVDLLQMLVLYYFIFWIAILN
jgi:hypothetical protein